MRIFLQLRSTEQVLWYRSLNSKEENIVTLFYGLQCIKFVSDCTFLTVAAVKLHGHLAMHHLIYNTLSLWHRNIQIRFHFVVDPCKKDNRVSMPVNGDRSSSCSDETLSFCDIGLKETWYKVTSHGQPLKIPINCVTRNHCGTQSPIWMNGK